MLYLIYGTDEQILIDKEINKCLKESVDVIDDFSVVVYQMDESLIQDCVADAETMPFGVERRAVICKNCLFLSNDASAKEKKNQDINALVKYIKNPADYASLILTVIGSLDEKNEAVIELKKNARLIKINSVGPNEWGTVIKKLIAQHELDFDPKALKEFENRTSGNLTLVVNELDKLNTFGKKITLDVVENLVPRQEEDQMFGMVDSILNNDIDTTLSIYNDLKIKDEDPQRLISSLATQFRFIYQVAYLNNLGYSSDDIVKNIPGTKPGRVYITLKKISNKKVNDILRILNALSDLDYKIKAGILDKNVAFDVFLVSEH